MRSYGHAGFRTTRQRVRIGVLSAAFVLFLGFAAPVPLRSARAEAAAAKGDAHDLADLATKMDDLQATVKVSKLESKELEKIGRDFGFTYRLHTLTLQYKQPDKLRLSGKFPVLGEAVMVLNGANRFVSVPRMQTKVENLEKSPGKRQSLLEYGGLISPDLPHFMQAKFVKAATLDGVPTLVYDLAYLGVSGGSHYRVWIDPATRVTSKREWYDGDNKLKATFYYLEPHEVSNGIWLPARVELKNAEGIMAATTTLDNVKVNQGLSDDLFQIKL